MKEKKTENKKRLPLIGAGAFIGAAGGYTYWTLTACADGACFIGSSPLVSMGYGALLCALIADEFRNINVKRSKDERN